MKRFTYKYYLFASWLSAKWPPSARENDEWHVAHARNLEEENKLIEVGFEYVRCSEKDEVAIYRKPK